MNEYANTMNNSSTVIKQIQVSLCFETWFPEEGGIWEASSLLIYCIFGMCCYVYFSSTFLWLGLASYSVADDSYSVDSPHFWIFGMIVFIATNEYITHMQKTNFTQTVLL